MSKLIKRTALVGLLSGFALIGAGCQERETGGAGTAGTETDLEKERRASELQQSPEATGGSGADDSVTGGEADEGESGMNIGGGTGGDIGSTDEELQESGAPEERVLEDEPAATPKTVPR